MAHVARSDAYSNLWAIVDGAVIDAFKAHPDYLTSKGRRNARASIVKRVTGTVLGFAEAKGRGNAADTAHRSTDASPPAGHNAGERGAGFAPREHSPDSQAAQVLSILERRPTRGLTPIEALNEIGCFRLGARIWDLRRDGHLIESDRVTNKAGKTFARYRLVSAP